MSETTGNTDEREAVARAMCKSDGTSQCAAICLSHFASSTRNGKCAEAVSVWGNYADAALSPSRHFGSANLTQKLAKSAGMCDSFRAGTARQRRPALTLECVERTQWLTFPIPALSR